MSTAAALDPQTSAGAKKPDEVKQPRDPAREVIETVVFVVVLVLLLKLFVTEAFVIPTGSMAETLYGYQKVVNCAKCGHEFPVNSHDEVEGRQNDGARVPLVSYCCPNCRHAGLLADLPVQPPNRTGDRVLVLKPLYHLRRPERGDVVVFKFPERPQDNHIASNYIKRAMGFGGETIAIFRGELYVTTALDYPEPQYERPEHPHDLWQKRYRYANSDQAEKLFENSRLAEFTPAVPGGFQIVRKSEAHLLADLRIVWDNDKQPAGAPFVTQRWQVSKGAGWKGDSATAARAFGHTGDELDWLRYQHLVWKQDAGGARAQWRWPQDASQPVAGPIDNVLGYNAGGSRDPNTNRVEGRDTGTTPALWVGDLCLECEVQLDAGAEVVLELSKGARRFQAKFGGGQVALARVDANRNPDPAFAPASRACSVTAGAYKLRFANVDNRLWVWVDGKRIDFGTDGDYTAVEPANYDAEDTAKEGWVRANDIDAPASIGAKGSVPVVRAIKLHRDVYYVNDRHTHTLADLYYVQPGHYLCLGDNSAQSSDSRTWGVVPERLMLGKAVFVFWPGPFESTGSYPWNVRWDWNKNRIGFIK
jgi:signal peptidase I